MANAEAIAVIVAGSGETDPEEVAALLDDFIGDTEAEVGLIVPVDKDLYTGTVENAVAWYNADQDVYAVQTNGSPLSRKSSKLGDGNNQKVDLFTEVFADPFDGFDKVYFLTALPDPEDGDFDFYVGLVEAAIGHNIEVKDLSAGLDDIRIEDEEPEADPAPEPEPEVEEKPKRKRRTKAEIEADKAAATDPEKVEEEYQAGVADERAADALGDLQFVVKFLEKNDEMFALRNLDEEVRYAPITKAAQRAFAALAGAGKSDGPASLTEAQEAPQEPAEAPRRGRGRPRTVEPEEKQIWDDEEEKWVKRPRGRIAKGTKTRTVNPETDEVLEEGEV